MTWIEDDEQICIEYQSLIDAVAVLKRVICSLDSGRERDAWVHALWHVADEADRVALELVGD